MTATNHALTGAVIGITVGNPFVAVPLAFASHFLLDSIPHFTSGLPEEEWLKTKRFRWLLVAEALVCLSLVGTLAALHPIHWVVAAVCAFIATSPDLFWIGRLQLALKGHELPKSYRDPLRWLHQKAQWSESPEGAIVEVGWLIFIITVLIRLTRS